MTDGSTGVYAHIKELNVGSTPTYQMRIVKLQYSGTTGEVLWGVKISDPSLSKPEGRGGLTWSSTSVTSCMILGDTFSQLQVFLMTFDSESGTLTTSRELYVSQAVDCQCIDFSSQVLLSISYSTGTTELISFKSGSEPTTRLRFVTNNYIQTGMGRTSVIGSDIWFFFPSLNPSLNTTITPSLQSMFITYLTDVTNMNWPPLILCTEVH